MRGVKIFAGNSHPRLAQAICERLGTTPAKCELGYFANGETQVEIGASIRQEDVFIIQSGSPHTNDSVMELLILIAACKGGSAKSITAVMPYFPYSRSSKKKTHRGSITAKMIANLMHVAGVTHVITVDLHASQMQGFFKRGIDNLRSEPLISRWIRSNVIGWQDAVVVSKNVGGSKRVTSLADALKLSFAIVSTDRTRTSPQTPSMADSMVFFDAIEPQGLRTQQAGVFVSAEHSPDEETEPDNNSSTASSPKTSPTIHPNTKAKTNGLGIRRNVRPRSVKIASSPLIQTINAVSRSPSPSAHRLTDGLDRAETSVSARRPSENEIEDGFHDDKAREVIRGRLVHGHIVDETHPSPVLSGVPLGHVPSQDWDHAADPMASSCVSTTSSFQHPDHALGGSIDATASSDDEEDRMQAEGEHTVTLVGNVKDKTVLLMDDLMDRAGSWIAAAETCVKRGGAKRVYCIGIHGLFGGESLEEMEACDCIDYIVVTNTFPIAATRLRDSKKLIVIDLSNLLSEAIRRNQHGESISTLFMHE